MTEIVFVAVAALSCTYPGNDQPYRCTYSEEIIVNADQISRLDPRKYKLGPIANTLNDGCLVTLKSKEMIFSGKNCRAIIGHK
jgi:hypothetical protein